MSKDFIEGESYEIQHVCHVEQVMSTTHMTCVAWECDECGHRTIGFGKPRFCAGCGRRVEQ